MFNIKDMRLVGNSNFDFSLLSQALSFYAAPASILNSMPCERFINSALDIHILLSLHM